MDAGLRHLEAARLGDQLVLCGSASELPAACLQAGAQLESALLVASETGVELGLAS